MSTNPWSNYSWHQGSFIIIWSSWARNVAFCVKLNHLFLSVHEKQYKSLQNQLLNVTFVSKTFGNQFCFPLKLCVHVDVFHSSLFAVFYTTLKVFQHKMSFAKQKQSFLFPLYLFNQKISYGSRKKKINNLILEVKSLIYLDRYLFTVFIFLSITSFIYLFFDWLLV